MKKILTIIALFLTGMFMFTLNVSAEGGKATGGGKIDEAVPGDIELCSYSRNYGELIGEDSHAWVWIYWNETDNVYKVKYVEDNGDNDEDTFVISAKNTSDRILISGPAYKELNEKGQCPNRVFLDETGFDNDVCIDNYAYKVAHHNHDKDQSDDSFCGQKDSEKTGWEFDVDSRIYFEIDYFEQKATNVSKIVKDIKVDDIPYENCTDSGRMKEFVKNKITDVTDKSITGWPKSIKNRVKKELDDSTSTLTDEAKEVCKSLISKKQAAGEITQEQASGYIEDIQAVTYQDILSELELSTSKYFKFDTATAPICGIFGEKTWGYVQTLYKMIKLFIPAIIVLLGMVDFLKVLFSGEEKDMKTSGIKFMKRIIAGIIFILLPVLIEFLIHVVGFSENCLQQLFMISL